MSKNNKKKKSKPNPDAQKVQDMIRETLFPEVYSLWLDNKITLLSALNLCLNVKLDFALNKFAEDPEDPEGDDGKPEDSQDLKGDTDESDA